MYRKSRSGKFNSRLISASVSITKIVFLFVFLSQLANAQSFEQISNGYRNTYWGESIAQRQKQIPPLNIEDYPKDIYSCRLYSEKDIMMGEHTTVYYLFFVDYLKSIGYTITYQTEIERRLISKFEGKKYTVYQCQQISDENGEIESFLFLEDAAVFEEKGESLTQRLIKNANDKYKAKLYIIDFNQLTRVYIYSNIIPGKITVVYTEAYQEKF